MISDAARSIQNAFRVVFGENNTIIVCWFHMKEAVKGHMERYISDQKTRILFWIDLDDLQLSKSIKFFDRAAELFVKKWERVSSDFMDYFRAEWLCKNRNWYESCAILVPSTNNCLESFQRTIKDEQTLRERTEISQFRVKVFDMIKQWSVEYDAGLNIINNDGAEKDTEMWTLAYQWAKSNIKISIEPHKTYTIFRIPSDIGNDIYFNLRCLLAAII